MKARDLDTGKFAKTYNSEKRDIKINSIRSKERGSNGQWGSTNTLNSNMSNKLYRLFNLPLNKKKPVELNKRKEKKLWKMLKDYINLKEEEINTNSGIYFLKCHSYIKIGIAQNIKQRISAIGTANPHELELLYTFDGDRIIENLLHNLFKRYGKYHRNEWFIYDMFTERIITLLKNIKDLVKVDLFLEAILSLD